MIPILQGIDLIKSRGAMTSPSGFILSLLDHPDITAGAIFSKVEDGRIRDKLAVKLAWDTIVDELNQKVRELIVLGNTAAPQVLEAIFRKVNERLLDLSKNLNVELRLGIAFYVISHGVVSFQIACAKDTLFKGFLNRGESLYDMFDLDDLTALGVPNPKVRSLLYKIKEGDSIILFCDSGDHVKDGLCGDIFSRLSTPDLLEASSDKFIENIERTIEEVKNRSLRNREMLKDFQLNPLGYQRLRF